MVGVLLDRDAWRELVTYVHRLEAEVDQREEDAVRRIITERLPNAEFEPGSAEHAAAIFAETDRAFERFRTEGSR
jgi:hypothetical protein